MPYVIHKNPVAILSAMGFFMIIDMVSEIQRQRGLERGKQYRIGNDPVS